jgi:hypothetical protein
MVFQGSKALSDNEKLYLKFTLLSGLHKEEAIKSTTLIQKLAMEGKLANIGIQR